MSDIFKSVLLEAAGISADHPLASVLLGRRQVIQLTQKSHDAALRPDPPGGLSHSERAALACRIARLNNEEILGRHYEAMIGEGSSSQVLADPSVVDVGDSRLEVILRHTDLVTMNPKRATAEDILTLKSAGIFDADIVRLSELIAFLAYQVRVLKGLRLMGAAT